eukprot:363901-Chlamydomonas_euryale.AAC.26
MAGAKIPFAQGAKTQYDANCWLLHVTLRRLKLLCWYAHEFDFTTLHCVALRSTPFHSVPVNSRPDIVDARLRLCWYTFAVALA